MLSVLAYMAKTIISIQIVVSHSSLYLTQRSCFLLMEKSRLIPHFFIVAREMLFEQLVLKGVKVPYHLTRTCYKKKEIACGKCSSCVELLEAFAKVGIPRSC